MFRFTPLLLCLALLIGCKREGGPAADATEVRIGEYESLTGSTATFGQSSRDGVALAVEEINRAGGVLGKPIKIFLEDDQSNADQAVAAVKKLIYRDKVVAVIGEVASKRSLSGGGVCQSAKVPMLTPASTNPQVTQVGDYVFRICFTDDFQGRINARFAADQGWKKVAVLTDVANDYSKGLAKAFKENFTGQIIEQSFREGDKNFESQLARIKQDSPDAVYVPAYYTEVGLILNQARGLGLAVPFFGGDGWDSPQTLALGPIADGCFYSDHYAQEDPRPEVQNFVKTYQQKHGKLPDAMAVLGYDAARVMADAIRRAGKADPAAIRDALAQTRDFPGASGTITLDANRNARKPIVILEVRGGKAKLHKTYPPE